MLTSLAWLVTARSILPLPLLQSAVFRAYSKTLRPAQFPGGKARSCEDLKARYYAVARALEGSEEGIANATLVRHPFNAQHERCACPVRPPGR